MSLSPPRSEGARLFLDSIAPCCRAGIANFPPTLGRLALARLEELVTASVRMPWRAAFSHIVFPLWLNFAGGRELAVSNYFQLQYYRLQDDLMDDPEAGGWKVPLAARYAEEAHGCYRDLVGPNPDFWSLNRRYCDQWSESVLWEAEFHRGSTALSHYEPAGLLRLARKAAALKIPCALYCFCEDRKADLEDFAGMVDHWQTMVQMADDWRDWRQDLTGGNYTYLLCAIAAACGLDRVQDVHPSHLKRALLDTDLAEDYFARARAAGEAATRILEQLGLTEFARALAEETEDTYAMSARIRVLRARAAGGGLNLWDGEN